MCVCCVCVCLCVHQFHWDPDFRMDVANIKILRHCQYNESSGEPSVRNRHGVGQFPCNVLKTNRAIWYWIRREELSLCVTGPHVSPQANLQPFYVVTMTLNSWFPCFTSQVLGLGSCCTCLVCEMLEIEPSASFMLDYHAANWAMSPVHREASWQTIRQGL